MDSWANATLRAVGYDCAPGVVQRRLKLAFRVATSRIRVEGTTCVPVHLAEALDGRDSADYEMRVEPSIRGGAKMAKLILGKLGLGEGASAPDESRRM